MLWLPENVGTRRNSTESPPVGSFGLSSFRLGMQKTPDRLLCGSAQTSFAKQVANVGI